MIKNIVVIIQLSWHMNCFYCYCNAYTLSPSVALSSFHSLSLSLFPIIIIIFIFHLSSERWGKWQQKKCKMCIFFISFKHIKISVKTIELTHKKKLWWFIKKSLQMFYFYFFIDRTPNWMSILCQNMLNMFKRMN